jgi:hypothetical protein
MMKNRPTYYRFEYFGFDGTRCVAWRNWRLSIKQAMAKFKYTHRFHTIKELCVTVVENEA